jgi:Domain of unknown function (DUF6894)
VRRYFFEIHGERGTDEDQEGIAFFDHSAAMLHAVTMCAEIGCSADFSGDFAINVRDEHGAAIGRVAVIVAIASWKRLDA